MAQASIQAVAREAGVSVSTVSRTFAKPDLVLPETRERVMTAAEKLNYRISRSAAALKSGQSFRIALLFSESIITWFNSRIYAGLDSVFHPAGYDISVFSMTSADERRKFFTDLPVLRNADAVVVSSFNIEPDEARKLKAMNVPIVGINIPSNDGFDAGVSIDDHAAEHIAVDHLVALGHQRIAYIGYDEMDDRSALRYSASARLQGFMDDCNSYPGVTPMPLSLDHAGDPANAVLNCIISASCVLAHLRFEAHMEVSKPSDILIVPVSLFGELCAQNVHVRCFAYELATRRFSSVVAVMEQTLFSRLDKRLAGFLLSACRETGCPEVRMTQEELAARVNSVRETVGRMLKRFAADGIIRIRRGSLLVLDMEKLENTAV